ncbi:alpha-ketoglutarate dependent xanthine dioxygenase [Aspergillus uvarum CBS 121591]|uniref:Alpha-ketoglutarate dependent xanthine dioxygenase n=1 Tax=Aspergillus uvarum CBS 121591 TaxID=1448315 RepID=A0A319CKT1_9EURO|nr:alpha-ketoglutarate dependent xanthine dioxygenase [Aspergillus uvarum CBS 121591]PYH79283.1 alpha-ketoglutarate dependent xanthine dioxygenase [Aspergillus uvarum CBS 121591]
MGATITGVDMNNLTDVEFRLIREAIYTHQVVIVKGQEKLKPINQFEFVRRLDPEANPVHGFLTDDGKFNVVRGSKGVTLVGQGYISHNKHGGDGLTLQSGTHADLHVETLSAEELASGQSRFGAFHFDGVIYGSYPSRVTTLRCVQAPKGPDVTIRWDDGTGRTMTAKPGLTAFINGSQLYEMLTPEEKALADNSSWSPAPQPYVWTGTRKIRNCGLGMAPGGKTVPLDQLPAWTSDKVYRLPMVWVNPVTGAKCFQILPDVVEKLYVKSKPGAEERTVEDSDEIRLWLNDILDRICTPENILIPEYEEDDVVMFNNWGVLHSSIDFPKSYGTRIMHQCHIASSTVPVGPTAVV